MDKTWDFQLFFFGTFFEPLEVETKILVWELGGWFPKPNYVMVGRFPFQMYGSSIEN